VRKEMLGTPMISDEALMLDFQRGSREAFEELFARYRGPLYGFFRRRLESNERAEDLAQDTFVAMIRAAERYEPRAQLRTYLYGIALKLLAAERRKHKDTPIEDDIKLAQNDIPDKALWVRESLAKLDVSEREILMLREYEQLSYAEIAELLRLPVNTVRSRLFRARMALKSHLEPQKKRQRMAAADARQEGDKDEAER
jgi:RNA polymerase sigma-70 factor (ECF subfamily)